ncbi:hypothetical protein Tco_0153835 [Tanacetum coccineum]
MNDVLLGEKAEAVSTACYVQNRVLIVKHHNKTPYELFRGFVGMSDEFSIVGYSLRTFILMYVLQEIQGVSESNTFSQQDQDNQDCIVMPIWKDASYFGDAAPRTVVDAQIEDKDALHNENDAIEKSHDDSSLKDNGTADQQVNTARPEINTGPSPASEDTQVEDKEIKLGNTPQSYAEEPKRVSKALSDPAWVEAMQEELLQFKLQKVWILVDLPKELLDYGYNFMNTVIYIDNNSTICIIENPVQHSKTKHIEIRHHFIRDCNAKKLIQMAKIDSEHNVADLLTKGFDAGRFQYLVSSIGMLNP